MSAPTISNFDYSALPEDVANACRQVIQDRDAFQRRTVESMADMGRKLIAIRDRLEHGQFLKWVEAEFGAKSSAYRLMSIAESFEPAILPTLGSLDLTAVHTLAAAPAPARQEIVSELVNGARLSTSYVRFVVSEAREKEKQEKAAAKLTDEQRKRRGQNEKRQRKSKEQREAEWERRQQERQEKERQSLEDAASAVSMLKQHMDAETLLAFADLVLKARGDDFHNVLAQSLGREVTPGWRSRTWGLPGGYGSAQ